MQCTLIDCCQRQIKLLWTPAREEIEHCESDQQVLATNIIYHSYLFAQLLLQKTFIPTEHTTIAHHRAKDFLSHLQRVRSRVYLSDQI